MKNTSVLKDFTCSTIYESHKLVTRLFMCDYIDIVQQQYGKITEQARMKKKGTKLSTLKETLPRNVQGKREEHFCAED